MISAIKVTLLLPNYFLREINYLFCIFIANSATTFWLSHVLHIRGCIIQNRSKRWARSFQLLLAMRLFLLFLILVLAPAFVNIYAHEKEFYYIMRCDVKGDDVYPRQFLAIFLLDVISAITDLIIFIVSPKIDNKSKRLREARKADIETSCLQKSQKSKI